MGIKLFIIFPGYPFNFHRIYSVPSLILDISNLHPTFYPPPFFSFFPFFLVNLGRSFTFEGEGTIFQAGGFFSLNTLNLLLQSLLACMLSEMWDAILTFIPLQVMCCLPQALFRFLFFFSFDIPKCIFIFWHLSFLVLVRLLDLSLVFDIYLGNS